MFLVKYVSWQAIAKLPTMEPSTSNASPRFSMTYLDVLLLGPPEVRWGDTLVTINRRVPRAILYYLASQSAPVGRETLLSLFWEGNGQSPESGRRRLREALSRLRKELPDPTLLISTGGTLQLDTARVRVDQHRFESLIQQTGKTLWQLYTNEPLPASIAAALEEAIALWRGDMFLATSSLPSAPLFDRWLQETNDNLCQLRERVLERLAMHAYACGALEDALGYTRTALKHDPFNDQLHYWVMRYLAELGQVSEAREYYQGINAHYQEELGIAPGAEVEAIYQALQTLTEDSGAKQLPDWELHTTVKTLFVGRKDERAHIIQTFQQHQAAIVLGESGSGKTRLLQKVAQSLGAHTQILLTTCRPLEHTIPMQPLRDTLQRAMTMTDWQALPATWAGYLSFLLPEILEYRPDLHQPLLPTDPEQARSMLMEAIRQAFLILSQQTPLLFVLDDAQWADEATLATLAYLLAREPFHTHCTLAVLARLEEMPPYLQEWQQAIQRSKNAVVIQLSGLSEHDVAELTRATLKIIPSPKFTARLHRATGGNALFTLEILRSIAQSPEEIDFSGETPPPLTESLRKLLSQRLQRVQPATRRALEAAAIIGPVFNLSTLQSVTEMKREDLLKAVSEMEIKRFIQADSHAGGEVVYSFIHDSIREALEGEVPLPQAKEYHRRVAEHIEENVASPQANILAVHYEAAGDTQSAFLYWMKAGQESKNITAFPQAVQAFQRARHLLDYPDAAFISNADIILLFKAWGEIAYNVNDTQGLIQLGEDLISLGHRRDSPALIGVGHDILSDACFTVNDYGEGLKHTSQALAHLSGGEHRAALIEAYNHHSVFLYMTGRIAEAAEVLEEALALGANVQTSIEFRYRSHTHYQLSVVRCFQGHPVQGCRHADLAIEDAGVCASATALNTAHSAAALAYQYLGNYSTALQHAMRSIELGEKSRAVRILGYTYAYAAMSALGIGQISLALDYSHMAMKVGEEHGHSDVYALGCSQQGSVHSLLGNLPRGVEIFQQGFEWGGEHFTGMYNLFLLGGALCRLGDTEKGLHLLQQAEQGLSLYGLELGAFLARAIRAEALAVVGPWEAARQHTIAVIEEAHQRSMAPQLTTTLAAQAQIELALGDMQAARQHAEEALLLARQIPHPWSEIQALSTLHAIAKQNRESTDELDEQLRAVLHRIRAEIHHAELAPIFQRFQANVLAATHSE